MIATLILEEATLTLMLFCTFSGVEAAGGFAVLEVRSATNSALHNTSSVCVSYNKLQNLPSDVQETNFHQLVDLSYTDGCTAQDFIHPGLSLVNSVVAVKRGTCNFTHKASLVQNVNGAAVLVVDHKNSTQLIHPGGSVSEFKSLNITLLTISHMDYMTVVNFSELVEVAIYTPLHPLWDSVMILMIVFPTILVVVGASWSAYDVYQETKRSALTTQSHDQVAEYNSNNNSQDEIPEITMAGVSVMFCVMCGLILLLYYFYDYIVFFFIALFCILGSYSLYKCLQPLWLRIVPTTYLISTNKLLPACSKLKLEEILLLMPCLAVGIYWVIERHANYSWIIQDLLGVAFCVNCIHTLRLPNLMVIMTLLLLLLVYDIFFVFVTPYFTSEGRSIMESVATGGRCHSKELLPLVFMLPRLSASPWRTCLGRNFTILGFGDVIVPGILVSYNAVFDVKAGNHMVYFTCSSVGYFVGMILCVICLVFMNSAQPALLYLVPGTLFSTAILAVIRQEFQSLLLGHPDPQPKADDHIEPGIVDEVEERDLNGNGIVEEQKNLFY